MPPSKAIAASRYPAVRRSGGGPAARLMSQRTDGMVSRAKSHAPLTPDELSDVLDSLKNVVPASVEIDWTALEDLLKECAHLSHKDWDVTGRNSDRLAAILLPGGEGSLPRCRGARQAFERILHEGNWDGATEHAAGGNGRKGGEEKWAVLVTGVNGIRKTTAMYQPWFSDVLGEALIAPPSSKQEFALEALPNGENSFFRQLDHMITTLCNEDFSMLYALTAEQMDDDDGADDGAADPPPELVKRYSNLKAGIFSRYRTLSELLGVLLLREARRAGINAMCETSGRDVAMFHYIDKFFPDGGHRKLALHFTIDDLRHAKRSVDARMIREMRTGREALATGDVVEVIYANAGGPYGSEVLDGVQADSDRVWKEVVMKEGGGDGGVGKDWYRAEMRIAAHDDKPWTIRAVRKDGSLGTEYAFGEPRTV